MAPSGNDFNAVRISLASPAHIKAWSYGEVEKPETINYRTLRPEKDGLFCEKIFGPTKDWECYCGKYKKIRYKGVICDRCGVEVARSKVRRERMGHVRLAAPVVHIWFSKGTPSRVGLLLDLSPRNLERVAYFAQYLVTNIDDELRTLAIEQMSQSMLEKIEELEAVAGEKTEKLQGAVTEKDDDKNKSVDIELETRKIQDLLESDKTELERSVEENIEEIQGLSVGQLLTESRYRRMIQSYAGVLKAGMGAEAIQDVLKGLDLDAIRITLQDEIRSTSGQRRKKAIKRLRVVEAFRKSGNKPEWMILSNLPVLPPELRPMVQLDGGRFATSDLNDLYRRVINRNNRLKRLIELQAPEIIIRNEKRMLQESVDALIDNGRRGRVVSGSHNHKLKSLSDLLRGKQGRFRQNLLGKRVDYSGRSVITVGPTLKLNQCGLPRRMALELFKPFVMNRLVMKGFAHNIKSAKRLADRSRPEVWDILEEVVKERPVLLNRAPTLHRLGIQAFEPILVEGGAIQVHPLVCTAFAADFDGDQMAVHVPLSKGAVQEAKKVMLSVHNILSPSSGEPIVAPTLDIVLGCYYMTMVQKGAEGTGRKFASTENARLGYELGQIDLRALVNVRHQNGDDEQVWIETTPGRIIFNDVLPPELRFQNYEIDKTALKEISSNCYRILGNVGAMEVLDAVKDLGFRYASKSGITIAINDIQVSSQKGVIVSKAEDLVERLDQQFMDGLITTEERYTNAVDIWTKATDELTGVIEKELHVYGGMYLMATSGAKGNIAQIKQMAGMRGLMSDPKGRIIDRPIKSNFREGLSVLEYFISTHGARKGLADTALRTADSGYLTRRLIDIAQEVIVTTEDCETYNGVWIERGEDSPLTTPFGERIKSRLVSEPVANPSTGEVILDRNAVVSEDTANLIQDSEIEGVSVRSPLTCDAERGVCGSCYGISLATWKPVMMGEAVGIIAAQSIGEPGTQLTMRTFHTGGIAGADITSGLPRVEELFEARAPKGQAILSEIEGVVSVSETTDGRLISVTNREQYSDPHVLPDGFKAIVREGQKVQIGVTLGVIKKTAKKKKSDQEDATGIQPVELSARVSGRVNKSKGIVSVVWEDEDERDYPIPAASHIVVSEGERVVAGQALTSGPKSPQQILRIQGREAVQQYLIEEVQKVYRSQGVSIHDRHIESIVCQMLRKVGIDTPGDTDLLPGEYVDRRQYQALNAAVLAEGGEPATASPVLLGITRASLNMESFLAAASFQETTRVLTESAINGDIDRLKGLKENVIIGRLIPARFDMSEEGRKQLGLDELESQPAGVRSAFPEAPFPFEVEETGEEIPKL